MVTLFNVMNNVQVMYHSRETSMYYKQARNPEDIWSQLMSAKRKSAVAGWKQNFRISCCRMSVQNTYAFCVKCPDSFNI